MKKTIDTQMLRLVGPDGKVCAVFEAKENGGCRIQVGNPERDGGIMLLAEDSGNCSITVSTGNGYSRFTIDTRDKNRSGEVSPGAMVSFRNAEDRVVLSIEAGQDGCSICLMDSHGHPKMALAVTDDDGTVIEATRDGKRRRLF